ncbi:uncharacterized protein LOC131687098 [Topomyia yanbarensis]|uniref:uncharacterized protein LOC131687098 n=1 Tax=Topomyia yanbarensis TaxID=2498891 RepID=UPI00273CC462|nr:uncharacterized protein LOC131687098 [Topomyia yanbarensis]
MISCMLSDCKFIFSNVSDYFDHLKNYHVVPVDYRYRCTVMNCNQLFSKLYPFKKHMSRHSITGLATESFSHQSNESNHESRESNYSQNSNKKQKVDSNEQNTLSKYLSPTFEAIDKSTADFTLSMHMKNNFTRKDVYDIQRRVSLIFKEVACQMELLDLKFADPEIEFNFKCYLSKLKQMFSLISSDHNFFKYLRTHGFKLPVIIAIENDNIINKPADVVNELGIEPNCSYLMLMPVEYQIKTFFECGALLEKTISNTVELEKTSDIKNFVAASRWKQIREKYKNDIIIPIWIYSDEFEVNDPQSSHSNRHSICGIYYSFPTFPEEFQGKLCNIFVAGMLKKVDIKTT